MVLVFFCTSFSLAEKKIVPIVMDDLLVFTSYNTTSMNLQLPPLTSENGYKDLVLQCEDDITYFIMVSHVYFTNVSVSASEGGIVIDEKGVDEGYISYIKGHVEGNKSVSITGKVFYNNQKLGETTKSCDRSPTDTKNRLEIPVFNGNSQGKLVIQCDDEVIYYIMAYDCLRQDTNPYVKIDSGIIVIDEKGHIGEVFYEKGHVERTGKPVTITGEVYSGGHILYTWPNWIQTCP